jgi:endoglucanase
MQRSAMRLAFLVAHLAARIVIGLVCIPAGSWAAGVTGAAAPARVVEPMAELDAWQAVTLMGMGVNIGNTLENTRKWETGWGNPLITKEYIDTLAALGFKTVRLPVAWDTYARDGRIQPDKLARVAQVADWITAAGMFCVVNIHWDGGWIDSSSKQRFPDTYATFSAQAERKYRTYWRQIASFFAGANERLLFEALNEETNFANVGSTRDAYATLQRVNQIFIDTVRKTGGNNAKRLLIVTGYSTDIAKTTSSKYVLPTDSVPHRLLLSVHYYTPWRFVGMTEDSGQLKMQASWGSASDLAELNQLFDALQAFCARNDLPAFIGEFGVTEEKETASRVRWMSAVAKAALDRKMVPVLWETGGDISRHSPHTMSPALREVMQSLSATASLGRSLTQPCSSCR